MDDLVVTSPVTTPINTSTYSTYPYKEICTLHNVLVSIKLGNNNYMIWKHRILKMLRRFELEHNVLEESPS